MRGWRERRLLLLYPQRGSDVLVRRLNPPSATDRHSEPNLKHIHKNITDVYWCGVLHSSHGRMKLLGGPGAKVCCWVPVDPRCALHVSLCLQAHRNPPVLHCYWWADWKKPKQSLVPASKIRFLLVFHIFSVFYESKFNIFGFMTVGWTIKVTAICLPVAQIMKIKCWMQPYSSITME